MENLYKMINDLDPPWNLKNKSLLVDEPLTNPLHWEGMISKVSFAQISGVEGRLVGTLGCLTPFVGLETYKPDLEIVVEGRQCNRQLTIGAWIGLSDFMVDKVVANKIFLSFCEVTKVWIIPDFEKNFPFSFLHLFSRGFNGWERATKWFESNRYFSIQKEVAIDLDEQAMKLWQLRSEGTFFYNEIRHDFMNTIKHVGCVATCRDSHWMNQGVNNLTNVFSNGLK